MPVAVTGTLGFALAGALTRTAAMSASVSPTTALRGTGEASELAPPATDWFLRSI